MKRKNYLVFFLASLLFFGMSCKKDEIAPLTERNIPQAIIKGKIFADLDVRGDSPGYENGPSGVKIIARIYAPDLAGGVEEERIPETYVLYETTTSGTGDYSLEVDANTEGLLVTLIADDFTYNQIQGIHPIDSVQIAPIRRVYSALDQSVSVIAGGTSVRDFYYNTSR